MAPVPAANDLSKNVLPQFEPLDCNCDEQEREPDRPRLASQNPLEAEQNIAFEDSLQNLIYIR